MMVLVVGLMNTIMKVETGKKKVLRLRLNAWITALWSLTPLLQAGSGLGMSKSRTRTGCSFCIQQPSLKLRYFPSYSLGIMTYIPLDRCRMVPCGCCILDSSWSYHGWLWTPSCVTFSSWNSINSSNTGAFCSRFCKALAIWWATFPFALLLSLHLIL